jgi:hypothetical protein
MSQAPAFEMERRPCPRCGATCEDDAGDLCQPSFDETGDACCPADQGQDDEGYFLGPTQAYLDRLDAYINEEVESFK